MYFFSSAGFVQQANCWKVFANALIFGETVTRELLTVEIPLRKNFSYQVFYGQNTSTHDTLDEVSIRIARILSEIRNLKALFD